MRRRGLALRWDPVRKMQVPTVLEEDILEEIRIRLWMQAKIRVVRINCAVGGKVRPNEAGIPDLMGWMPQIVEAYTVSGSKKWAIPLFIEVKRPGGARRAAQIRFIEDAKRDGCAAFFAESWTDVMRELYSFGIQLKA